MPLRMLLSSKLAFEVNKNFDSINKNLIFVRYIAVQMLLQGNIAV